MKKNRMDIITDLVKDRMNSIYGEIEKQYGGSNPYRQVPMTKEERLQEYLNMTPDILKQRVERDGRVATNNYIAEMEKLKQVG